MHAFSKWMPSLLVSGILLGSTLFARTGGGPSTSGTPKGAPQDDFDRTILPIPEPVFRGEIGITPSESRKDFPREVKPPQGAPNVVIIMPDDVGFAASEVFSGLIPTPAFQRVAEAGLKFNRFHTTAQCSPTRAALLTGRNHHTCGTGAIMEMGVGYPGYNTVLSRKLAGLGEILKYNGYNTAWFGKNHNVPDWQNSQAGPYDLWPTGLGFEYFYGFIGGDTSQWEPALYEGTKPIEPPHDVADYHFDVDLADKAIERLQMLHAVAPEKPFFFYYVPGTAHAPHHARRNGSTSSKGSSTRAGTNFAKRRSLVRKNSALFRQTRSSPNDPTPSRLGTRWTRNGRKCSLGRWRFTPGRWRGWTTRSTAFSTRWKKPGGWTTPLLSTSWATTAPVVKAVHRACLTR